MMPLQQFIYCFLGAKLMCGYHSTSDWIGDEFVDEEYFGIISMKKCVE